MIYHLIWRAPRPVWRAPSVGALTGIIVSGTIALLVSAPLHAGLAKNDVLQASKKGALADFKIPGCVDVDTTVFYTWSCPQHPASKPELCKEEKRMLESQGKCRANLAIVFDDLFETGKVHPQVFHRKYTGFKSSGPFTQLKDKQERLWWVQTYHWSTAKNKINPK